MRTGYRNALQISTFGPLAQLGERLLCKQEVTGSNPVGSIHEMPAKSRFCPWRAIARDSNQGAMEALWKPRTTTSSRASSFSLIPGVAGAAAFVSYVGKLLAG